MADKTTHFGGAGEFFAMSELLLRGWNVAVPVVDVGDDVFVVDDNDKTTYRLQVKSAEGASDRYAFNLSRRQLREPHQIELIYMLLMRFGTRWRFLVIPRVDLVELRDVFEQRAGSTRTRGAAPKADVDAKTDGLTLAVSFDGSSTVGWDADLSRFLDQWPNALPQITGGPGARGRQPVG